MYEHPYTVSNKLKEMKITVHQIHLDSLSVAERNLNLREIGRKDALNQSLLLIIKERYLGDVGDVNSVVGLYEEWLEERLYDDDVNDIKEIELFNQLLAAISVLADYTDNKAAELYSNASVDSQQYGLYIGLGLFLATVLSLVLLMRTLKTLKAMTDDRRQYLNLIDQNVMITAIDDKGIIFDMSNELGRFLSKDKKEVAGKPLEEVLFIDSKQYKEMWQKVGSGQNWSGDLQISASDDSKWLGVDVLPMQNNNYRYSGFRLLAHDITSRKSLEKISITDTLTGLLNRRTLDETIERTSRLSSRNKTPLTVAIFDVDFFKQYNDTYGHMAGDKVLTRLSSLVSKMLGRPDDYIFRIGGEEFCIIFNSKTIEDSKNYLDKIRKAVQDLEIAHEKSTVDKYVTISIGGLFLDGNNVVDTKVIFSEADDNLYKAKETRNQSVQTEYGFHI